MEPGDASPLATLSPRLPPIGAMSPRMPLKEVNSGSSMLPPPSPAPSAKPLFTPLKDRPSKTTLVAGTRIQLAELAAAPPPKPSHYRLASRLPAELAAAAAPHGWGCRLYHHPLSAHQAATGWCRELDPAYVLDAGWLDGRCAPIDGGSYTLVGSEPGGTALQEQEQQHRQLKFEVRVVLAALKR